MYKKIANEIAFSLIFLLVFIIAIFFVLQKNEINSHPDYKSTNITTAGETKKDSEIKYLSPEDISQESTGKDNNFSKTGRQGATYTNTEYGFQFTMPKEWMDMISDYAVSAEKPNINSGVNGVNGEIARVVFGGKTQDMDWINYEDQSSHLPKGYPQLFELEIWKKDVLQQVLKMKICTQKTEGPSDCPVDKNWIIANSDQYTFVFNMPQDVPSNFKMYSSDKLGDYPYNNLLDMVKKGLKILNI